MTCLIVDIPSEVLVMGAIQESNRIVFFSTLIKYVNVQTSKRLVVRLCFLFTGLFFPWNIKIIHDASIYSCILDLKNA